MTKIEQIEKAWKKLKKSGFKSTYPVRVPIDDFQGMSFTDYPSEQRLVCPQYVIFNKKIDYYQLCDTRHEISIIFGNYDQQTLIIEIKARIAKEALNET